jgi:hypothetical protein
MDDLQDGTLTSTPSAETPGSGASSDTLEIDLDDLETEGAGDGQPEGEDELDDWEEEGRTYKVPKALVPKLMKDRDYTQKTMTLAEERKATEAERKAFTEEQKFIRENADLHADIRTMAKQIEAFLKIPPEKLAALDPGKKADLVLQFNSLKARHDSAVGDLQRKQHEALEKQREKAAKQIEDGFARIAKEIPGWSDELAGKLNAYAMDKGYSLEDLEAMPLQPHAVGTLHKAYLYDQLVAKQRARAKQSAAEPEPKPVPKVATRRSAPSSEPQDTDPPDVWARKRDAQARKVGYR